MHFASLDECAGGLREGVFMDISYFFSFHLRKKKEECRWVVAVFMLCVLLYGFMCAELCFCADAFA